MNIRLLSALFLVSFFNPMNGGITLRFEGRDNHEKQKINSWLSAKKECRDSIIASVGLLLLDTSALKEGVDIVIPGDFKAHCPNSVLTLDNSRGRFALKDTCTYVIRLKAFARHEEKYLKNFASKTLAAQTWFCVQEISS